MIKGLLLLIEEPWLLFLKHQIYMATHCSFHLSKLTDLFVQHLSTMAYQVFAKKLKIFIKFKP
jgi:hypothetical protein